VQDRPDQAAAVQGMVVGEHDPDSRLGGHEPVLALKASGYEPRCRWHAAVPAAY
jgi:hypothetical protein